MHRLKDSGKKHDEKSGIGKENYPRICDRLPRARILTHLTHSRIDMYDCTNRRGSGRVLLGFRQLLVYHKTSLVEADHQRVLRG